MMERGIKKNITFVIPALNYSLLHEKFLQFDWLRAVLHVKITKRLWVVV